MINKSNFSTKDALYVIERIDSDFPISKEYSFDTIKKYIEDSAAYNDSYSRIIIEKDKIYFGHGLMEIEASLPKLRSIFGNENKSFSEENIIDYGSKADDATFEIVTSIKKQQKILTSDAKAFFKRANYKTPSKEIILGQSPNPTEVLFNLIDNNETLAIGEMHSDKSSKKLLIDNMRELKQKGVEVIYLEHCFFDTQKELFDAYFNSEGMDMPVMLRDYLERLDHGFKLTDGKEFSPYTFTGLVIQAKRYGIKIIPIDTVASYSTGNQLHLDPDNKDAADRCLMMNYVAAKSYEDNLQQGKSLFFVGSIHINSVNSGIPGIAEITQCPTLVVQDKGRDSKLTTEKHPAQPDAIIYMESELSDEAKKLQSEYQLIVNKNAGNGLNNVVEIKEKPRSVPQEEPAQSQESKYTVDEFLQKNNFYGDTIKDEFERITQRKLQEAKQREEQRCILEQQSQSPLGEIQYAYGRHSSRFYHAFTAKTSSQRYTGLKGDVLKRKILNNFRESLNDVTLLAELEGKITGFEGTEEYRILAKGQGFITRIFGLRTDSIKEFERICEEARARDTLHGFQSEILLLPDI